MKLIGGQAVIEGVLMKSDDMLAVSVRLPNNKIVTKTEDLSKRKKFWRLPFFRGIIVLWDTLIMGIKALSWSANQQLGEDEKITKKELAYTLFISILFAMLFFVLIPFFIAGLFTDSTFLFNFLDGLFRILVLFTYIALISRMDDVKSLFQYHGAEHMVVHAYEHKDELIIKNIEKYTTLHPRCGTAFLMIVLAFSIVLFSFIPWSSWQVKLGARIVLIPVIASFSYEVLKLSNRFKNNPVLKLLILPGLWFQKITTKKPSKKQLEVALASLKAVL